MNTNQIQHFKIISDRSVATGVRRIEAITGLYNRFNLTSTGKDLIKWYENQNQMLSRTCRLLDIAPNHLEDHVRRLMADKKSLEKELEDLKHSLLERTTPEDCGSYRGTPVKFYQLLDGMDSSTMQKRGDKLITEHPNHIHVLVSGKKIAVAVNAIQIPTLHAGNLIKEVLKSLGGKGGGRQQLAMGELDSTDEILSRIRCWISTCNECA